MTLNKLHGHGTIKLKHILSKKNLKGAAVTMLHLNKQKMEVKFWLLVYILMI